MRTPRTGNLGWARLFETPHPAAMGISINGHEGDDGEFYSVVTGTSSNTHAAFIDTGMVNKILPNASVDLGCNFGLPRPPPATSRLSA